MATFRYYLKNNQSEEPTQIYLSVNHGRLRFKIYTGFSILPKHWNSNKQIARNTFKNCFELNLLLEKMRSFVYGEVVKQIAEDGDVNKDIIREKFDFRFKNRSKPVSFYEYFEKFIELHKAVRVKGVIKNYKSTLKKLKKFEKDTKYKITYDRINNSFYEKFVKYLIEHEKLLNPSAGKYIRIIKTFMNWSVRNDITKNMSFKEFKILDSEADTIYLSQKELDKIEKVNLSDENLLNKVRDYFLFSCYTGLRYSDLQNIKAENIHNNTLTFRSVKTKEIEKSYLSSKAKAVLDRILERGYKMMTNQTMNRELKILGEMAGIDDPTEKVSIRGAERVSIVKPKYKFITTHTGKRTFITLSLEKGLRQEVVMAASHNKDQRSFKKYIRLSDKVVGEEIEIAWK